MNTIIVMFEDRDKELNISLYDFIDEQYQKSIPIIVCHVTKEEYNTMRNQVKNGCLNERFSKLFDKNSIGYINSRYLLAYDKISNNLLVSDYSNTDKRGTYIIDAEGIHYQEDGYQITDHSYLSKYSFWKIKIYTTKDYNDIIEHYSI